MGMWTETVNIQGPYNFDLILSRLALDPLHEVNLLERRIKVPLRLQGEPMVVLVQGIGTVDDPAFSIQGEKEEFREEAVHHVRRIFRWNESLHEIATHFAGTDLRDLFEEHRGTAIVLDFDYFNCLVKCIIHQQLNLAFAHTLTERFVHTFGIQLDGVWFYPKPEEVALLTVEELRALQFSTRKAEYVIGLAKTIAEGHLDLEALAQQSDEEIMNTLIKIRGIGRWTAENFLLFGVGRPNHFPKADIGIQNAIKKWYNLPQKPTMDEMEKYSKPWSPYLSYASLYLWRSIET